MAESTDIGVISMAEAGDSWAKLAGAVTTAERLGYIVDIRVIRSPHGRVHSLVASATWQAPGTATAIVPPRDSGGVFKREPGR